MFNRANTIVNLLQENGYNIEHQILPNIAHNEREAKDIMKNNSNISGAQGILSVNGSIIRKLYEDMNQNKNNDKILQER